MKFCKFHPRNSFSTHKSEMECIKYNRLDLLVTANFPFDNNRDFGEFLLQLLCKLKQKPFQNFYGQLMEKDHFI